MANNSFNRSLRDYAYMVLTLVVLYCGIVGALIVGLYQRIFKPCQKS